MKTTKVLVSGAAIATALAAGATMGMATYTPDYVAGDLANISIDLVGVGMVAVKPQIPVVIQIAIVAVILALIGVMVTALITAVLVVPKKLGINFNLGKAMHG